MSESPVTSETESGSTSTTKLPGFTSKYRVHRLVYFERFQYLGNAIAREKTIKGWLRQRKIALIEAENRTWEDLSESWFNGSRSFASLRMTVLVIRMDLASK